MKRRNFLELTLGTTLATLGLNRLFIKQQGLKYAQVLAQNTPRKLALLVGINRYQSHPLFGCITDVYLQRELLIHRFGFQPQDILMLTDETEIKPTRQGILQAFEEHLIKQAKPNDIVVFHYSGHGSRVIDPNSSQSRNSTFVPLDREIKTQENQREVSDIMGKTLFLLMSALPTENVSVILDSCHSGGGKRGNLRIRAIASRNDYPNQEELAYQQQWLSRLNLSPENFEAKRQKGIAKGVVIASAQENQYAADVAFDGFFAGAFTYAMTQYLWQQSTSQNLIQVMNPIQVNTTAISTVKQIPNYEAFGNNDQRPVYFINQQTPPAEAVVTKVENDSVKLWLGGIPSQSFSAFNQGASFTLIDQQGNPQGLIRLESRRGIDGVGKILNTTSSVKIGNFLQEETRVIPANFRLVIGLDNSLSQENISNLQEQVGIQRLEFVPLGMQQVNYILGRVTPEIQQQLLETQEVELPPLNSIGLYGQGLDLLPNSFGNPGENLTDALRRLKPKLQSLLALNLIKLTLNAESSQLNISSAMKLSNGQLLARKFTIRGQGGIEVSEDKLPESLFSGLVNNNQGVLPQVRVNSSIEFTVTNNEQQDLYVTVLVIDSEGSMNVIFPNSLVDSDDYSLVKAGSTRLIPDATQGDRFSLRIGPPLGMVEVLIIGSVSPLNMALKAIQNTARRGNQRGGVPINLRGEDSLDLVDGFIKDLGDRNNNLPLIKANSLAAVSLSFVTVS